MNDNERNLYKKALTMKGEESQVTITIEEMAEAIHALSKYKRLKEGLCDEEKVMYNIISELADVQVMIEQMIVSFNNEDLFSRVRTEKLNRLRERLNKLDGGGFHGC